MLETILSSTLFLTALIGIFFVPGWVLLSYILRLPSLSFFEKTLLSFALGLGVVDIVMLVLDRLSAPLNYWSIGLGIVLALLLLFLVGKLLRHFFPSSPETSPKEKIFTLSRTGSLLFILLIIGTLGIKTLYLSDAILPTSTDLGHHMYWSKLISEKGTVPDYVKSDVVVNENNQALISSPRPIADFIIGEHLPFAAIAIFTGLEYTTAFPILFLFLINLLSILACITVAWRMALSLGEKESVSPELVLLTTFLFLGPLYTLASPQAKYVSGGVVGNTFGNFLIPLVLLFAFRGFSEKRSSFLGLSLFFAFLLAYTHHLSTLVLFFILLAFGVTFLLFHFQTLGTTLVSWYKLLKHPALILLLGSIVLFLFFVALPSYLDRSAIDSAIGTPTKTTRTGLSFLQTTNSVGMGKIALGLTGLFLFLVLPLRKTYGGILLLSWSGILLVMTLFPHFLLLDIPSNRIGSYLVYPLALAAAFGFILLVTLIRKGHFSLPVQSAGVILFVLFIFVITHGSLENMQSLSTANKAEEVTQTFAASEYLQANLGNEDILLKDHNYIVADGWIKLFFLRDYSYPLSRGFFSRYTEGGSRREQCTLRMISVPNTLEGKRCFEETGTNFVMVNPRYDAVQFEKSPLFKRLYESDSIHIYERQRESTSR